MRETNQNATGNEKGSRVIERFKQIIHPEPEVIQENSNTKYYIIGALFLLSCLTWYYYGDNITPVIGNGIDKIKSSFRRKPDSDGSATTNITQNSSENLSNNSWNDTLWNIWSKIKSKFIRNNQTTIDPNSLTPNTPAQIEIINKSTKYSNVESPQLIASTSKLSPIPEVSEKSTPSTGWIGENAMDQYFKDGDIDKGKSIDITNLTESEINRRILEQTTGSSIAKFEIESEDIMNKMTHYIETHENGAFPNVEIKQAIYTVIKTKMTVLYLKYKKYYLDWIIKPENSENFNKFKALETEIETLNANEVQNNYEEVASNTAQEQEAWSDDANSSVHSPYVKEEQFDNKSMLGPFLDELDKLPDQPNIIEQVEAEVKAEAAQATAQTDVEPKSGINALWDAIKARRNDTNVIDDTNKEPVLESNNSSESTSSVSSNSLEHYLPESQNQQSSNINPKIKVNSPEISEAQTVEASSENTPLGSILEAVKGLVTPKVENKEIEPSVEVTSQTAPKSGFINLFESIKARRDDSNVISSPNIAQVGLQTPIHERLDVTPKGSPLVKQPSISNLLEDTNALFELYDDDDETPLNPVVEESIISPLDIDWDHVTPKIIDGTKTEINFQDIWRVTDTIIITTSKNHDIRYKFDETNLGSLGSKTVIFDLKDKVHHITQDFPDVKIREIFIEDTSHNKHTIFRI
jgi:hypothetical protein